MTTIIDILSNHNHWATRRLLESCRELSPDQFTQRFEIGCGSLHDNIRHIIGAMHRWADRLDDRPLRPDLDQKNATRSIKELTALLDDAARDLHHVVSKVRSEKRIHEKMTVTAAGHDQPFVFTRGSAIVHVFTHGVHHRAQCLNIMRHLGVSPDRIPDLDAIDAELAASQ